MIPFWLLKFTRPKDIINKWISNKEYKNGYLSLINKIVYFAPLESFIYLEKATKYLTQKKTNNIPKSGLQSIVTTISMDTDTYNSDHDAINLESIEPIISKLIYAFKNNIPTDNLKIEHIIKYLTSEIVINLPKPYYDNQTLESIFEKLVSPLDTVNFDVILTSLNIMAKWIEETNINEKKIYLLKKVIDSLLSATFDDTRSNGVSITWGQRTLNLNHDEIIKTIKKAKYILFKILENKNQIILTQVLDSVSNIGGHMLDALSVETQNFYIDIQKEALLKCIDILTRSNDFVIISKIEDTAIRLLRFTTIKNESLEVLGKIKRSKEYFFFQLVRNTDVPILDYDNFYNECMAQDDIKEWIYQSIISDIKNKRPIEDDWKIINNIEKNYTSYQDYLNLLNPLDTSNWNSYSILIQIFRKWLSTDNRVFTDMALNHFNKIEDDLVFNVLKEALLLEEKREVSIDDISEETREDDVKIYINALFKNYTDKSIDILNKIIDVSKNKEPQYIRWIISLVSGDMYFKIRENTSLYEEFEHIIIQFLDWQLEYNFDVESYITHHILHDTISNDDISDDVINLLEDIVKNDNITIREYELTSIYKILEYGLKECIEILYNKLTSLKENGNPKHIFTYYFDSDNISEVELLNEHIGDNEDFKFLVKKVLEYYESPIKFIGVDGNEHEAFINLDYFFKYTVKKEYLEELFNELYYNDKIDDIKLLYKIVPVNSEYLKIIVNNLNILEDKVDEKELIHYLNQVDKIKSWFRSHGENSSLLLDEETLFTEIMNSIDSLSLQLKLKEQLKYIELQKREELEDDISHLLDK